MKEKIISKAEQKRLDRFAEIRKEFNNYSGSKTLIVKKLSEKFKASLPTIYKALNS